MRITADNLIGYLNQKACYNGASQSFSPLYSNIGIDARNGAFYIHFNRRTAVLYAPFFDIHIDAACTEKVDSIYYQTEKSYAILSFYDMDAFLLDWNSKYPLTLCCQPGKHMISQWIVSADHLTVLLQGYFALTDNRDPDRRCPYLVGIRAIHGSIMQTEDGSFYVLPDAQHHTLIAVSFACLDFSADHLLKKLQQAPENIHCAIKATRNWIWECTQNLDCSVDSPEEAAVISNSIRPLLMNLCKAPGLLRNYVSSFPNRGTYPTHYLWDSCFQNLAYELLNPSLARDAILQLTCNIRPDGKIPQFICSTWSRPHEVQPPLIGWAAQRLEKIPGQEDIGLAILPVLEKNCHWWLTHRMTKYGLIETANGLETGWDNSPRFDHGPILALDMNSYLIRQLRYVSELCRRLGRKNDADFWRQKAETLATRLVELCYNPDKKLFFDFHVKTGKQLNVLTPAAFLPLWAGVPLNRSITHVMIEDILLSPKHFFGEIPFPSVAYDDPTYECANWWRGPTWLPVAYLMLKVLDQYSYQTQARVARERLCEIIQKDGKFHELFNSQTGEGLGSEEQGWTAACFLRIKKELNQPVEREEHFHDVK